MRANNDCAYSTTESEPSRIAPAAALSVRLSGFIVCLHGSGAQLLDVGGRLFDIHAQLLGPFFAKLFFPARRKDFRDFGRHGLDSHFPQRRLGMRLRLTATV